jgi:hypothetical protein
MDGVLEIALNSNWFFTDTMTDDFVIRTQNTNQNIAIGVAPNAASAIYISSNLINFNKPVSIGGGFQISGQASTYSNLTVGGNATICNNIIIGGNTTLCNPTYMQSNLVVTGTTTLSNNLLALAHTSLSNTLNVSGSTTLSNTLTVTSNMWVMRATSLSNTLNVSGTTTLSNALTVTSNLWVNGAASLSNNLNVFGSATVSNITTLQSNLVVAGTTTLSNNLYVLNPTSLSNTLDVSGTTTLSNALTVTSNLWVNGAASLSNNLNVFGSATISNITALQSNLVVAGMTTLSNNLYALNPTSLSNTLDVSGRTTLSNALTVTSNLWVNGAASLSNNLNVFGSATVSNITTLQSNLVVAGMTTLSNNLYVLNPTSLSNTLDVSGRTTLSNALTVTSNLWVNGATSLSNNLNVFGSATVSNITTLQSNLVVAGTTTLSNNLYVLNPTSLSNTLDVSGRISFSNALTVTSNLWVNGATSLSNALNVSGVSTFSNAVQVTSNIIVGGSTSLSNPVTMSSNLATYGTATICNVATLNSNLTFSNMGMVTVYTSNNNLGINTSNPTNKLSIVGGLSVLNNIQSYSYPNAIVPPGNVPQAAATYSSGGITYTFSNAGGNGVNAACIFDGSSNSITYFDGLGSYNTGAGGVYGGTAPSTSNISGAWLQTLSSAPFIMTSYAFSSTSDGIREWYVFGSTDGTTWTQLDRVALSSWTYGTAVTTFNITNPTAQYSYYRFVINKGFSGAPVVNDFKWYALTSLSTVGGSLLICASNSSEQFEFSGGNAKFYQNVYTLSNMAVGKSNPAYTLDVAGTASISGNTVVGGTATFSNSVTMLSNLTINGNFSLGTSFIAGSVSTSIGSNLVVGGTSTLSNNVNMLSNSYVAGKTTLSNTLDVAGTTTLSNALTVTSNLWVNGATSLSNTLNVSGVSTFSNAITVTSNINVKGLGIFENNTYVVNTFTPAVSYPPPASTSSFTSGSVTVSGQPFGNGTYTIATSSQIDQFNPGHCAYDSSVVSQWISTSAYNIGTGNYTGAISTTVGSSNYPGEWVDITLPNSVTLSNINILSGTDQINYGAKDFYVVGSSNNGTSWNLLIGVTGYSSWTTSASSSNQASTFSVTNGNTNSYNRFRIIVNKTVLWDFVRIQYISLFAYTGSFSSMGVRTSNPTEALDVLGNLKVSSNVFVLSNLGIGKSNPLFNLDLVGNACISGPATLSNTLNVSGAATMSNALTVTSNLWVNGAASFSNNLNVYGAATVSNITTLQSNLVVAGPATFSNNLNILSNVTIMGQLTVSNVTYITSNITIYSSETIQSNLAVFNQTTLCNALNIYGVTTNYADIISRCNFQTGCNLTVGGATTLSNPALLLSNLVVNGTVAFSNTSFYQGRATFSNVAVFNSNIALSNFGTVNLATSNNMLGINTTAPTEALDFNGGNAKFSSNAYVLSKLAVGFSNPQHGTAEIAGCNVGGDVTSLYLRNIGSNNSNNLVSMVFGANQSSGASGQAKVSVGNENFNSGYGFLAFYTNSNAGLTERMRVTAQGFTGIGTSNPTNPLHVYSSSATQGAVSVQSTTSNMGARITLNNTDDNTTTIIGNNTFGQYNMFGIGTSSISPMVFVTSNAERARIDSTGNMGVGTAAPAYKVDIIAGTGAGVTNCNALRVWTQASNATYADAIVLSESAGQPTGKQAVTFRSEAVGGTYVKSRIWSQVGAGYNATMMGFDVADSSRNAQTRMVIDVAGNVGINNTAPTERLQLTSGNAKFDCNVYAITGLGVGTSNLTQKVNIVGTTAISGTPLTGQQNTAAAAAYILMSTTDNNTGPGLAIQNIATNNQAIYFDSYYNSNEIYSTATAAYSVAKSNAKFLVRAAAPGVAGSTLTWGTAALSVIGTGSVGINNENPSERLDLQAGNAKFGCNVYVGSNLGINNLNPQYALDVVGAINFTGVLNQNGSPFVGSRWTSNTQGIFYNFAPCNVGIGTCNLAEKFNVDTGNAKFGCNVYIMSNLGISKSNPAVALDVGGSVNITGSTVISGTATFSNPVNALSNLTANGPVLFQNTLTTSNVATFNSNVVIQGQAFLSNFATFCNNVTMLSNLSVNGATAFSNTLGVSNVATFTSNVIIQGQSIHTGAASFSNPTTMLSNLSVNGPVAFSNTLGVSNIATFTSNVVVQGQVNITGAVTMSNVLSVSNVATFTSNIVVQGSIIQGGAVTLCNPLTALSNMTVQGTLNVSNVGTFASNVIIQGQSVTAGTATFSNPTTMLSNLIVNGTVSFSNTLGVSNIATFTSNVIMQGTSVHTGTATFSNPINALSNLTVNGPVSLSNTLAVNNVATFLSNVVIQGQLTVSNVTYITSNITIYSSETIQSNLSVLNNIFAVGPATFCNPVLMLSNITNLGQTTFCNVLTTLSNIVLSNVNSTVFLATSNNFLGVGRSNPDKLLTLGPVSAAISNPTFKMYNFSNSTFEIILSDSNTGVLTAAGQGDTVLRSMSNIVLTTLQPAFTSNVITAVTNAPTNHVTRAFATDLTQANASSVSSWGLSNPFSQGTTSQQPIYYSSGGFSNTSFVSFVTASNSHLSRTNLTYNINTNGGLTIISMMRFNTNQSFPRIFTAGSPGYIEWSQSGLSMTFNMGGSGGPGNFAISTGNVISIGEWAVFTVRLNGSTNATSIYKNYTSVASGTSAYNSNVTMTTNYIGRSLNADPYLGANISYFLIYDSFVPDATLSNVVSAMFSSGSMTSTSYFNSLVLGSNSVSISGTTIQGGTATFCNTTNMLSNLTVSGPASFSNVATFTSNITATGIATFCNQINALSNLTVNGPVAFSNTLGVSNVATFTSNVIIQGQSAYTGSATFSNTTTFASNVFVQGQVSIAASNISMSNYGRAVLYSSNNNFGIGTQNPLTPLHIQGDATISGQLNLFTRMRSRGINIALNQGTPPSVSAIQSGFTTTNGTVSISTPGSNTTDSIAFITGSNPNSEKMRITGTGAVGIGTNSPAYTLDVNGSGRMSGTLNIGTNTQAAILSLDDIPGARWQLNTAGNVLNFLNDSTGSFVTKMGISSAGSMGIQNALTVNSNATTLGTFGCSNTGTFNSNLSVGGVLSVGGAVNLSNNTTILGTLGVSNVATFSNNATVIGTLGVSNNTTLGGTLTVGNVATFNSNVIINGTMTVSNVTYVTSNIYIYSSEIVQSNLTIYNATTMCNVANVYNVLTAYSNIAMSNANGIITVFTSNSSLGIGTSNPAQKLDVNGAINALGYCNLMVNSFSSTSVTQVPTASNLTVAYNIAVAGSNAGIWGSNLAMSNSNALYPQATFASNAGAFGSNTAFAASNYAYTNIPGISNIAVAGSNAGTWGSNLATTSSNALFPQATFASNAGAFGSNTASAASNQAFNTWAYSNTIIYNLGSNVGVNTSNSVHRLNVNGDIWSKTLSLRPDGTYDYIASNLLPNYGLGVSNSILNVLGNGGLNMRTGTNSNAIFVTSVGLVGISNPTPSAQLDVAGTSFRVRGGASATPTTFFLNDTGTSGTTSVIQFVNNTNLITCTDSNPFSGVTGTGAAHQMYYISDRHNFRSNVNVTGTLTATTLGVGTTTPAYTLDVKGTISGTSNLYIGSNVGPGQSNNIDPTGATGNIIASGNISAGNLGMFRNRIINGDMRINQRGLSSYGNLIALQYTIDRFRTPFNAIANNTSHTLTTSGGPSGLPSHISILTNFVSNNGGLIEQAIEQINVADCVSGTAMTLSFWARSGYNPGNGVLTLTAGIFVPNSVNNFTSNQLSYGAHNTAYTLSSSWTRYVVSFVVTDNLMSTNGCMIQFLTNAQCGIGITGLQLEKGSIATPFEFRPFAIELQLCQRYFCTSYDVGTAPGSATQTGKLGTYSTATSAMLTAYYPVIMRTIPNVTVYGGNTGTVGCANLGGTSTDVTANKIVSTKSVNLFVENVGQANNFYYFHYDASAEL